MAVELNDELLTQIKTALRLSSENYAFDETSIFPWLAPASATCRAQALT